MTTERRKSQWRKYKATFAAKHPERLKELQKQFQDRHPGYRAKYQRKYRESGAAFWAQIKCRYGLTKDQYNDLITSQNGLCAACLKPFGDRVKAVDHDHESGKVRGILHRQCNSMIGLAKENPVILESAANYLWRTRDETLT